MDEPTPSPTPGAPRPDPSLPRRAEQLLVRLEPVVRPARVLSGAVRRLTIWTTVSGLWIVCMLFLPFQFSSIWAAAGAVGLALFLLVPAGVLYLFYRGLEGLMAVPARLVDQFGVGRAHADALYRTAVNRETLPGLRWLGRFARQLLDVRGLILDSKDLLLQYTVVVRLVNPLVLGTVLGAAVLGFVWIGLAVLATLLRLLLG